MQGHGVSPSGAMLRPCETAVLTTASRGQSGNDFAW